MRKQQVGYALNLRSTVPAVSLHPRDVNTLSDVLPSLVDMDFHILKSPRCRCTRGWLDLTI